MDMAVAEAIKALSCEDPRARQGAANRLGRVLTESSIDGTPAVPALAQAVSDPDTGLAGAAANTLRIIAQYRRGNIGEAVAALARAVPSADQELRKNAAEALIEAAENGPGIAPAVPALEAALTHKMKHVRMLATSALAAHLVDRKDLPRLEHLVTAHPRADVRERAAGYLRRGAEWKDISFAVPLLCRVLKAGEASARRRTAQVLEAYLSGPKGVAIPLATRRDCARAILECLTTLEGEQTPEIRELRERASLALRGAVSPDELEAAIAALREEDVPARGEAAYTLQLASNAGIDIEAAVPYLQALLDGGEEERPAVVFALVKHLLNRRAYALVGKLLAHREPEVRAEALTRIDLEAIESTTNLTPLVGPVSGLLKDEIAEVRERAAGVLRSFAMFGSAADKTDLSAAAAGLQAARDGGDESVAKTAGQALRIGAGFGKLPPDRKTPAGSPPPDRCMHGSPRDPETGQYLCGWC
ncbi:MAG: hypothetical protein DIJKHBIC_04523 [Thermoanaerobaculia bacterium]|nr:hypothetical protein [Thermoanaerobaculia bacterium]